jgi:hypothetical protein
MKLSSHDRVHDGLLSIGDVHVEKHTDESTFEITQEIA